MAKIDEILEILNPIVETTGFEIIDGEYEARSNTLRIFIDFQSATFEKIRKIGLEDCVTVDRAISPLFEEEDSIFNEGITLEVSSPGVNRPLKRIKDFERFVGENVKVKTFKPLYAEDLKVEGECPIIPQNGRKQFGGKLLGLAEENERLMMEVEGHEISIPRIQISKANLDFDFKKLQFEE